MFKQTKKVKKASAAGRGKGGKSSKRVYYFGPGKTEGRADMKDLLGGKGAQSCRHDHRRPARPPRLHHHHRHLCRVQRSPPEAPRRPDERGPQQHRQGRARRRQEIRQPGTLCCSPAGRARSPCPE